MDTKKVRLVKSGLVTPFTVETNYGTITGERMIFNRREWETFINADDTKPLADVNRSILDATFLVTNKIIRSWDVVGDDDKPLPVTVENILGLPDGVWADLYQKLREPYGEDLAKNSGSSST